jgi:hypothetical protein
MNLVITKGRGGPHQIPDDQGERGGVAEFHGCFFSTVRQSAAERYLGFLCFAGFRFPAAATAFSTSPRMQ